MEILIIAAHPDDEVLGCGGSAARFSEDHAVHTLILGEGVTSRDMQGKEKQRRLRELREQALRAAEILGTHPPEFHNFPDNRFDAVPLLDLVKVIERSVSSLAPDWVFIHHHGDLNIDHRRAHLASLAALRPGAAPSVKRILSYEVPSSTDWRGADPADAFTPAHYIDISPALDRKIAALRAYAIEIREYPHPRSPEALEAVARKRGIEAGFRFAEAFMVMRSTE